MEIVKTNQDNCILYKLSGRLDAGTAPQLEEELASVTEPVDLVFDLADLEYISSAGLRVLVFTKQKIGNDKNITIKDANEFILEVLETTGLLSVFIIQ